MDDSFCFSYAWAGVPDKESFEDIELAEPVQRDSPENSGEPFWKKDMPPCSSSWTSWDGSLA